MDGQVESEYASGLRALINRLVTYKVPNIGSTDSNGDIGGPAEDRFPAPVEDADVVSSLRIKQPLIDDPNGPETHALVLDIDHPAWLVRSSTPGHYHLYVDVPNGIGRKNYERVLDALAVAGVIEPGYAGASKARGFTSVRLPWVKKEKTA